MFQRNPDILLYCLPWGFPAWVGNGTRSPYQAPELTASYVVKYIQGAKKYYNLTFDYVGVSNIFLGPRVGLETLYLTLVNVELKHYKTLPYLSGCKTGVLSL